MASNDTSKFEFLSAKVILNPFKQPRPKGGFHYPEYTDESFEDPRLKEREQRGVEYQLRETTQILSEKTLKEENEVFLKVYTKANPSEMEVKSILDALKANVVAYIDIKQHGMLISGSLQKLEQLSNKDTPKYLTEKVRIIKSITKEEQIEDEILNISGIKMLIFSIIPNLDTIKNKIYISILQNFFSKNNCKMYGEEFQKFGFILADATSEIINELIQKSTFIFKVNLIPDGVAQEIRESTSKPASKNSNNSQILSNPYLPKVVLMDSGVNDIPSLHPILLERSAYIFQDLDDEHDNNGHGTPIANLIAFGENGKSPSANIISYKIWSSAERTFASRGLIRGIEEYANKTRLFVTSIGIPQMPPHLMVMLDRLIQSKNVCLVASGGNLDFPEIKECLTQGGTYPDYLRGFPVTPPANTPNVIAIGSIAKKISSRYQSIAPINGISPHSRCGTGAYDLFECKKPQLVEHGGNVNIIDGSLNLNSDDVGVNTVNKSGQSVSLTGSSFSSPLFIRKLIDLERVYRNRISNIETMLAISYLSCTNDISNCAGYGESKSFTHTDHNSTVYLAEGTIGFTQVGDDTMTTPINDIIIYVPPSVNEIKFCLTHSDDFNKSVIPTLETYFDVKAKKMGNTSLIPPENQEELNSKTNVKMLTYKFDSKSMESMWTFSIRPRVTHAILTEDKRNISARFGCAILLTGKSDRKSLKPLTQEIIENREKFSA